MLVGQLFAERFEVEDGVRAAGTALGPIPHRARLKNEVIEAGAEALGAEGAGSARGLLAIEGAPGRVETMTFEDFAQRLAREARFP